jgi:hypothetical protein
MNTAGVERPVTRGTHRLARSPERAEKAAGRTPDPFGVARHVAAWRVSARPGRRGESWLGTSGPGVSWLGGAWQSRLVAAGQVRAWYGAADIEEGPRR